MSASDVDMESDPRNLLLLDGDFSSQLEYLAEGAANIVYRVNPPQQSPGISSSLDIESDSEFPITPSPSEIPPLRLDPRLEGQLVRLRKSNPGGLSIIDCQNHFDSVIRPLFPEEHLIQRTLFRPTANLIRDLNRRLRHMETFGSRARKRHGVYLDESEIHGTLITDMTCGEDDLHWTSVEFKPKWLAQSPSAPAGAKRCRTCALRAMRSSTKAPVELSRQMKSEFCPISLVCNDPKRVAAAADIILGLPESERRDDNATRQQLITCLLDTYLLQLLRRLQMKLDPIGVLTADVSGQDFLTAMTIRDCTLFLKIPRDREAAIEARFGDLDLKTPSEMKVGYWRDIEQQLIDGGWYMGTEGDGAGQRESLCQLSMKPNW